MSVRIRMKKMGRAHRSFFRICAIDKRAPRDGRVLEELGTYDPSLADTDARAVLKADRVDYWLSVGAQPSDKVAVLIKKYGTDGTHADAQKAAIEVLAQPNIVPDPGKPASMPKADEPEPTPEAATAESKTEESKPAEAKAEGDKPEEKPAKKTEAKSEEAAVPAKEAAAEATKEPEAQKPETQKPEAEKSAAE